MKKLFDLCLLLIIGFLMITSLSAQGSNNVPNNKTNVNTNEPRGNWFQRNSRIRIEPNLGGSFGGGSGGSGGFFQFMPLIGYELKENFIPSAGPMYMFFSSNGSSLHMLGARAKARFYPFQQLYLTSEYQYLRSLGKSAFSNEYRNIHRFPVGAGYVQRMGRGGIFIEIQYDLLYKRDVSPFGTGLIYNVGVIL